MKDTELIVLSCVASENGGGAYRYRLTEQGRLERIAYLPCDKPMYAVLDGKRLHILLRAPFAKSENSGYFACKINFTDCSELRDTLGKCACHLASNGSDVYIVNYLSGNIVKNCEKVVQHSGKGVNLPRQDRAHTHFAAFSPDKKYVLCCDLGLDTVFIYDRNLREISRVKGPDGYGIRHLVFSEDGKYFYTVNELVPSVSFFAYSDGRASYISKVLLPFQKSASTAAAIRLERDGSKIYVSVRGENAIFVLKPDCKERTMTIMQKIFCGGDSPRDFDITEKYIICTNERSDNIMVIDKISGRIADETTLKTPLCVLTVK